MNRDYTISEGSVRYIEHVPYMMKSRRHHKERCRGHGNGALLRLRGLLWKWFGVKV